MLAGFTNVLKYFVLSQILINAESHNIAYAVIGLSSVPPKSSTTIVLPINSTLDRLKAVAKLSTSILAITSGVAIKTCCSLGVKVLNFLVSLVAILL